MKISELKVLVDELNAINPDLDVCYFHDLGPLLLEAIDAYDGDYENPDNKKLLLTFKQGPFIGIGNPANFDIDTPLDLIR